MPHRARNTNGSKTVTGRESPITNSINPIHNIIEKYKIGYINIAMIHIITRGNFYGIFRNYVIIYTIHLEIVGTSCDATQ
jgi:hypothetical protein